MGLEAWVFKEVTNAASTAKIDERLAAQDFWSVQHGMLRLNYDQERGDVPVDALVTKFAQVLKEAKRLSTPIESYGYLKLKAQHLAYLAQGDLTRAAS